MRVALLGFDPGIRDTGAVALTLDFNERTVQIMTQVWSGVTRSEKLTSLVDEKFLDEAAALEQNTRAAASATVLICQVRTRLVLRPQFSEPFSRQSSLI